MDLNFEALELTCKCLRMKLEFDTTTEYFHNIEDPQVSDFRYLVNGKKDLSVFENYPQVFDDKFGFLNNLSVLDLLFNEGKFAMDYLKNQVLIK